MNENTFLIPDPAFTLECKVPVLPQNFQVENMVGINISPMIIENESIPGITMESYRELIDYVINETNMGIALIPHVVWSDSDDRKPLMQLYKEYEKTGRVVFFEDHNCMELKGIISKCRFWSQNTFYDSSLFNGDSNISRRILGKSEGNCKRFVWW